jgi:thiol-disulfide isomerase/thioredoxin
MLLRRAIGSMFLFLAAGCATTTATRTHAQTVGQPMPPLVFKTLAGATDIRLEELRGKVVLLDIWASWCGPCKEEMPVLDAIAARWKTRGVEVVAVSIDEDRAAAEAFLASRASWNLTLAHDPQGRVPEQLQPEKMPTSYIIDAGGVVRHVNAGFVREDAERLESRLGELASAR